MQYGLYRKVLVLAIVCCFVRVGVLEVVGINTMVNSVEMKDEHKNHWEFLICPTMLF